MLKNLFAQPIVTAITIGGETVQARRLSGLEQALLLQIDPEPSPPLVADPDRGSLAPKIPDTADPAFRAALASWEDRIDRAFAAVALGAATLGTAAPWPEITLESVKLPATREAAQRFLAEALPVVAELGLLEFRRVFAAAVRGPSRIEEALKNS